MNPISALRWSEAETVLFGFSLKCFCFNIFLDWQEIGWRPLDCPQIKMGDMREVKLFVLLTPSSYPALIRSWTQTTDEPGRKKQFGESVWSGAWRKARQSDLMIPPSKKGPWLVLWNQATGHSLLLPLPPSAPHPKPKESLIVCSNKLDMFIN